ncbi:PD-(D/E)XK nuclease family protein [Candidatus Roizmanbacteria bacterium]|nr:PD-(D/E)XK nuclease family protein [Candidatus Roizmanbacteria bacterium]
MGGDKFTAIWVSHTSISDFLKCPRAYYLKNVYKDPKTGHKIQLMAPPLALGQAVHEVIESLSVLPVQQRFSESLIEKFERVWQKVSGKKGGFANPEVEYTYKERGKGMLRRVMKNPGPLLRLAVKIKEDLPHFWLSEESNIILCGKIDWLEYFPETDSVHIIDFKTSKQEEDAGSLQLAIYHLLVHHCQNRKVDKASYWYVDLRDELDEKVLPSLEESRAIILDIAKKIKTARQLNVFKCPHKDGCYACRPMESILRGEAEFVGVNDFRQDIYIANQHVAVQEETSIVL